MRKRRSGGVRISTKVAFVGTGDVFLKYYLPDAIEQDIIDVTTICDIEKDRAENGDNRFESHTYHVRQRRSCYQDPRGDRSSLQQQYQRVAGLPYREEPWWILTGLTHPARCISEDRQPDITIEHARHLVEVMEKSYIEARSGKAQEITAIF